MTSWAKACRIFQLTLSLEFKVLYKPRLFIQPESLEDAETGIHRNFRLMGAVLVAGLVLADGTVYALNHLEKSLHQPPAVHIQPGTDPAQQLVEAYTRLS